MKIKKGDQVKIMKGKDKGREGKVLAIAKDSNRIVVENINMYKKHVKQAGIVDITKPLDVSKVRLICPACKQSSRIGYKISADNKRQRYCKKCNSIV